MKKISKILFLSLALFSTVCVGTSMISTSTRKETTLVNASDEFDPSKFVKVNDSSEINDGDILIFSDPIINMNQGLTDSIICTECFSATCSFYDYKYGSGYPNENNPWDWDRMSAQVYSSSYLSDPDGAVCVPYEDIYSEGFFVFEAVFNEFGYIGLRDKFSGLFLNVGVPYDEPFYHHPIDEDLNLSIFKLSEDGDPDWIGWNFKVEDGVVYSCFKKEKEKYILSLRYFEDYGFYEENDYGYFFLSEDDYHPRQCLPIELYKLKKESTTAITLNRNGGTGGSTSVTGTYGSALPSITIPSKTGYTFLGYFTSTSGGTKYINADGTSAKNWDKTDKTFTLYAQWEKIYTAETLAREFNENIDLYCNGGINPKLVGDNSVSSTWATASSQYSQLSDSEKSKFVQYTNKITINFKSNDIDEDGKDHYGGNFEDYITSGSEYLELDNCGLPYFRLGKSSIGGICILRDGLEYQDLSVVLKAEIASKKVMSITVNYFDTVDWVGDCCTMRIGRFHFPPPDYGPDFDFSNSQTYKSVTFNRQSSYTREIDYFRIEMCEVYEYFYIQSIEITLDEPIAKELSQPISEMLSKYDYIYQRYGNNVEMGLDNFLNRPITPSAIKTSLFAIKDVNSSTWVVVAVSLVSVATISLFIFLKKRKQY